MAAFEGCHRNIRVEDGGDRTTERTTNATSSEFACVPTSFRDTSVTTSAKGGDGNRRSLLICSSITETALTSERASTRCRGEARA